jgi:anthranilate phosphoribosyltransferase
MSELDLLGGWPTLLSDLIARRDLTADAAGAAMSTILAGDATAAQIAAFAVALRSKGESAEELSGLLAAALVAATFVPLSDEERAESIDIVGTGGDGANTINVSTMAALVAAGAGASVCKHGNRSASSMSGTADVFELLGVAIEQTPAGVAACLRDAGIGFCFARVFHPAFRFAGSPRSELGVPTFFNLLGPMANPGRVKRQLIGVADPAFALPMVEALQRQGLTHAWVIHGDGLDELTTTGPTSVLALQNGSIERFTVEPEEVGLRRAAVADLRGGSPADNADAVHRVLAGVPGPHRDIVVLNAGAALVIAGVAGNLAEGVDRAAAAIDDGRAAATLDSLIRVSQAHSTG